MFREKRYYQGVKNSGLLAGTASHVEPRGGGVRFRLYTSMYIYIYIYVYTDVCKNMYICIHIYTYICVYIYIQGN